MQGSTAHAGKRERGHSRPAALLCSLGDVGLEDGLELLHRVSSVQVSSALQMRVVDLDREHPSNAAALNTVAEIHQSMGEYTDALLLYDETLKIRN